MKVIYADFNDFTSDGVLPLTCSGSIESIAEYEDVISDGESVWLSDGELWTKARIYLCVDGVIEARADWYFHDKKPDEIG